MPHDEGRKSRWIELTMMTNRSSHMPMLGKITIPKASHGLRRTFLLQKKHRYEAVKDKHAKPGRAVGTKDAVAKEREALVRAAADIGDEKFHQVDVGDEQRHEQDEPAAHVDVP